MPVPVIRPTLWITSFFSLLALPGRLPAQQAERYTVLGDEVAIYNLVGEIKVESGAGPGVTAEVTRGGADKGKIKVVKGELDGRPTLRFIYPSEQIKYSRQSPGSSTQLRVRENGTFADSDDDDEDHKKDEGKRVTITGNSGLDAYADLRIIVPSGKELAVYLAVGKVAVSNVEGEIKIDAASAPVSSANTRGELRISVGSGAVQVTQSRGELNINTGSGAVAATDVRGESININTGSGEVTASDIRSSELSIQTGSGDIRVGNLQAPKLSLETGSGLVSADVSGELWNVDVKTGSGDITLKVPPTIGAEVDIETSSGDIETDFEVAITRHARDHMTGRIGDGRGKIDIETGSGEVKLVKGT